MYILVCKRRCQGSQLDGSRCCLRVCLWCGGRKRHQQLVCLYSLLSRCVISPPRQTPSAVLIVSCLMLACCFECIYLQAFFKEAYKARVRKQQDGDEARYVSRGGRGAVRPDGWLEGLCQVRRAGRYAARLVAVVID